jgi:hypothetical protein
VKEGGRWGVLQYLARCGVAMGGEMYYAAEVDIQPGICQTDTLAYTFEESPYDEI